MHHRSGVGYAGSLSADLAVGGQPAPLQHRSYLWLPLYSGLEVTCHLRRYINCRYFYFFSCFKGYGLGQGTGKIGEVGRRGRGQGKRDGRRSGREKRGGMRKVGNKGRQ